MIKDKLKKILKWDKHSENMESEFIEDNKKLIINDKNKRKIENIVVFIVILIITIIAINMIWNGNRKIENEPKANGEKVLASEGYVDEFNNETIETAKESLEYKLENILKQIKGVGKVKVLVTYSQTSETLAMYNEDISQSNTEETDTRWWK